MNVKQVGKEFTSYESAIRSIGDEFDTWDGYRVRVTGKKDHSLTSWRYEYTFLTIATAGKRAEGKS